MNTEQIEQYIMYELSQGNERPYKQLLSFVHKIYRNLHKDKVKDWNYNYQQKIKQHNNKPHKTLLDIYKQ